MFGRRVSLALLTATVLTLGSLVSTPAFGQVTLYDNGPDGDIGYFHVNFGSAVTNSFTLSEAAEITKVVLTIYDVDDRNTPEHLKWTITTEPFGGTVKGSGFVGLSKLEAPYLTKFLFFAWKMDFAIPNLSLPAGTYYLQIQDVVTRWDTWAFWAESVDGSSAGYYEAIAENGAGRVSPVGSESFSVTGQWTPQRAN